MKMCCDHPLLTPFCPLCGKPNNHPLMDLVSWLRKKSIEAGKNAASREKRNSEFVRRSAAKFRKNERELAAWADAVIELLQKER